MGGSQRVSGGHWLRRNRRFRSGSLQTTGNNSQNTRDAILTGLQAARNWRIGFHYWSGEFSIRHWLRTAVGTRQLLIKRVQGFIPREVGGGEFKAFVSCRLTTHTTALSAKEWNKIGNARSARQFWKSRSVIVHRILSRERQLLKQCYR